MTSPETLNNSIEPNSDSVIQSLIELLTKLVGVVEPLIAHSLKGTRYISLDSALKSKMNTIKERLGLLHTCLVNQEETEQIKPKLDIPDCISTFDLNFFTADHILNSLNRQFDEIIRTINYLQSNLPVLVKELMIFWRRIDIMVYDIPGAFFATKERITNLPKSDPQWRELDEITHTFRTGSEAETKALYDEDNNFLYIGQIAHAKTVKAYFEPSKISESKLSEHFKKNFFDYEQHMVEKDPKRFKVDFKKTYVPTIGPGFWTNLTSAMMNKERAQRDLEFYLCYANNYAIKDFWLTSESYLGKITRHIALAKVEVSKRVFIPVTFMDHLLVENSSETAHPRMLRDKEAQAYFDKDKILPKDIFQDSDEYTKIGIRIISKKRFKLKSILQDFTKNIKSLRKKSELKRKNSDNNELSNQWGDVTMKKKIFSALKGLFSIDKPSKEKPRKVKPRKAKGLSSPNKKDELFFETKSQRLTRMQQFIKNGLEKEEDFDKDNINIETIENLEHLFFSHQANSSSAKEEMPEDNNDSDSVISDSDTDQKGSFTNLSAPSVDSKTKDMFRRIVIFIHGGGYIALSSGHHQLYTRLLAADVDRPIFSIDYRLAPGAKYPKLLEDCLAGYFWILNFCRMVIGVEIEHITLLGDSAGGGLAASMTAWLIENNQHCPDLLQMAYASMSIEGREFRISAYIGLEERLLHYSAMKAVHDFYLPSNADEYKDYYLNPVLIPKRILAKFPVTRLYISMKDPLRDDQIVFARNLQKASANVIMNCFEYLQHGVLTANSKDFELPRLMRNAISRDIMLKYNRINVLNTDSADELIIN